MNTESKSIFKSKTFWGALLGSLPAVLQLFKVDSGTIGQITTMAGTAVAIYGRIVAEDEVHVVPPKAPSQEGLD